MDNIFDNKIMKRDFLLVLLPYLLAKGLIIWGEVVEFDDFPASIFVGIGILLTYLLLIFNVWNSEYRLLFPLLAISAFQLVAVKDGSYNAFLQTSALIGFLLLGIFLQRGLRMDFTGLVCGGLALSTGVVFLQSI